MASKASVWVELCLAILQSQYLGMIKKINRAIFKKNNIHKKSKNKFYSPTFYQILKGLKSIFSVKIYFQNIFTKFKKNSFLELAEKDQSILSDDKKKTVFFLL